MSARRWMWGVVALVVIVVLVVLAVGRQPATFDEDTPEGVVQRYLEAVFEGDEEAALAWLTPEVAERCERYLDVDRFVFDLYADRPYVARLGEVEVEDGEARVVVDITEVASGDPFGGGGSTFGVDFHLVRTDDGWRIDHGPWPVEYCDTEPIPEDDEGDPGAIGSNDAMAPAVPVHGGGA